MNVFSRGVRNAFRSGIRTTSIVIILGISVGLALTMLVARSAVEAKIESVKSSIGTTISVSPAGFAPGAQANNTLSTSDLDKVTGLDHVTTVASTLSERLSTTGSETSGFGMMGGSSDEAATTSLESAVTLNRPSTSDTSDSDAGMARRQMPANFSFPITFLGTTDSSKINSSAITITQGKNVEQTDAIAAVISDAMAEKNSLKVGSTFTAYDQKITVAGIFTTDTEMAKNTVVMSLASLQKLSDQTDTVSGATVTVDSLDNLETATAAVKKVLPDADITSAADQAEQTTEPLQNVATIALYSLIGSLIAGAVIILLTMMMIVRERRHEIGVLKAIGSSNGKTMLQFMTESVTLTLLGLVVGLLVTLVAASPITNALVSNSESSSNTTSRQTGRGGLEGPGGRMGGGGFRIREFAQNGAENLRAVEASVGWSTLGCGVIVAMVIAVLGSAVPAYFISKIRPSDVIRAE